MKYNFEIKNQDLYFFIFCQKLIDKNKQNIVFEIIKNNKYFIKNNIIFALKKHALLRSIREDLNLRQQD